MLPVPKFMLGRASRRRGDERAILTATTDARAGDRLMPAAGLTVRALREAVELLRREGVRPRDVAGFGPAFQLDAPQAQVAALCRTVRFQDARSAGEYRTADRPWWGQRDPERFYVLMKAEPSTVVTAP